MKRLLLLSSLSAIALAGCSKTETATSSANPPPPAKAETASSGPVAAANAKAEAPKGAREVAVTAGDNMKFDVTRIEATAGEKLKVTLKNGGSLPKEAMGHNWVLLTKGSDANAFSQAALTAKATEYIPAALAAQVVAHTKLLGPKQSDSIEFTVPAEPGEYTFICSFPAHAMAGMKGVLVVK